MKIYLKVPFADKDEVKQLGAKWDGDMKSWYIPEGADESTFSKWETHTPSPNAPKIYISVPFADKDAVKQLGARWDGDKKSWYYTADKDASLFSKWEQQPHLSDSGSNSSSSSSKPKSNTKNYNSPQDQLSDEINQMLDLDDPPF